jgi:hypothetical protein
VVPIAAGAEAIAVDSRSWPPEVAVAYETEVQAQGLQGGAVLAAPVAFNGMDRDRQASNLLVGVRTGINSVLAIASTKVAIETNLLASLPPVVRRPVDAEYDTATDSIVVLRAEGHGPLRARLHRQEPRGGAAARPDRRSCPRC